MAMGRSSENVQLYPEHYETFHRSLLERRSGLQKDDDVWDAIEELDGVDTAAIRAESQADWVQQTLASNYQLARQLNISGTPTFVIGDNMLRGAYPQADIQAAIDEAS
ncbi:DsbA family protein [Saccharospirillum mangrovi]|uniref:DsbA family protein n=2 Tax=Saccharospirillum mangrovi TaxID=2161747 RepID=UPI000E20058F|nr:DsbA family protein [Saccharospirillum mangrovi]